ncbi:hypothetical protein V8C86DRAFT_3029501, partial [Haematococcus lacustris]
MMMSPSPLHPTRRHLPPTLPSLPDGGSLIGSGASLEPPQLPSLATRPASAQQLQQQHLAAAWLASWAEASPANCNKLAGLEVVQAVASLAGSGSNQGLAGSAGAFARQLHLELIRLIRALAEGTSSVSHAAGPDAPDCSAAPNHLAACVEPLLFMAADAAVEGDDQIAGAALDALSALLNRGGSPVLAAVAASNAIPLMKKLSTSCGSSLRIQLSRCLAALASSGALQAYLLRLAASPRPPLPSSSSSRAAGGRRRRRRHRPSLLPAGELADEALKYPSPAGSAASTGNPAGSGSSGSSSRGWGWEGSGASSLVMGYWTAWLLAPLKQAAPARRLTVPPPPDPHPPRPSPQAAQMGDGGWAEGARQGAQGGEETEAVVDPRLPELQQASCACLTAWAQLPGLPGLQVRAAWLSSLIASLAQSVAPYTARPYHGPQVKPPGYQAPHILHCSLPPPPLLPGPRLHAAATLTDGPLAVPLAGGGEGEGGRLLPLDLESWLADRAPLSPAAVSSVCTALEVAVLLRPPEPPDTAEAPPHGDHFIGTAGPPHYRFKWHAPEGPLPASPAPEAPDPSLVQGIMCEAVEALNALVATDEAKQRWLLQCGVLPLLLAIMQPSPSHALPTAGPGTSPGTHPSQGPPDPAPHPKDSDPSSNPSRSSSHSPALPPGPSPLAAAPYHQGQSHRPGLWPLQQQPELEVVPGLAGGGGSAGGQQQEVEDVFSDHDGPHQLRLQRQVARLLALVALLPEGPGLLAVPEWSAWLAGAARDSDCRLASTATKALLNLRANRSSRPRPRG